MLEKKGDRFFFVLPQFFFSVVNEHRHTQKRCQTEGCIAATASVLFAPRLS